jgi:carboxymethylenebutenolidase
MTGASTADVLIPLPDGNTLRGALALPGTSGVHSGVVVLHEAWGLNDDIRRICRRLAGEGYVAMAPDLYSHGSKARCLTRVMMDTYSGRASAATLDDIEATRAALAERPEVDGDRIAIIGFCQGGGFALAFAVGGAVRAASVNYGAVPAKAGKLEGVCPVVGSYGARDRIMGRLGDRLERHLTELGVPHDVKTYPDVGHSFLGQHDSWLARLPNPMSLGYSEQEAEDAWTRIFAFFAEHVGAPAPAS